MAPLWRHPQNPKPKTKNIFSISTRRLAKFVDGLNSSLVQSSGELWRCKSWSKRWPAQDGGVCLLTLRDQRRNTTHVLLRNPIREVMGVTHFTDVNIYLCLYSCSLPVFNWNKVYIPHIVYQFLRCFMDPIRVPTGPYRVPNSLLE